MELPIPSKVKKLWDKWNLRVCILISLSLQVFLVLFGSSRQRCKNSFLLILIWGAYLLADWVAAVAIGLTTKSKGEAGACDDTSTNQDISAFWASFLLLHLGGPDSITSFALEDNEFWVRHLFGLFLQALAAAYSFFLTLPKNKLWPCTVLVFIVGIVKYAERTCALYLASVDRFGATALPDPVAGPDYEETSTTYASWLLEQTIHAEMKPIQNTSSAAGTGTGTGTGTSQIDPDFNPNIVNSDPDLDEMKLLKMAYKLFKKFKGLIVGFFFAAKDRDLSRTLFLGITDHKRAFRLMEYEFSFMFQVLHTKVFVMRHRFGYVLRGLSFCSILVSAIYFFQIEKKGFGRLEIILTYALLIGAIILDATSMIKFFFSDWTLAVKERLVEYVPSLTLRTFILKRSKWSRLVFQYNMIDFCLLKRRKWLYKFTRLIRLPGIIDTIKVMRFSSSEKIPDKLEELIFKELQKKSMEAISLSDAVKASQQRGDLALSRSPTAKIKLKWSIAEFQYAESLLLWHIATEICHLNENSNSEEQTANEKRHCKILSDYMFYLLIKQPNMLSTILGNWNIVFQDTCLEAKQFFDKHAILNRSKAWEKISSMKLKFRPIAVKGTISKSVFFDACILARQLQGLGDDRWDVMDQMWVELMCYAAINCRPNVHAQQPSRGGEFLTFTWLLMNHFGLGIQFSEEQSATKMAVVLK